MKLASGPSGLGEKKREAYVANLLARRAASQAEQSDNQSLWKTVAADIGSAAQYTCGRRKRGGLLPCTARKEDEVMAGRARVKEAYSALCAGRGTVDEKRLRETHKNTKRAVQNNERCMRGEVIRETIGSSAVENEDSGKMYHGLRQLGVRLQGKDLTNETSITTKAAKEHFLRIGGEPNHAPEGFGLELLLDLPPNETLSETPSYEAFFGRSEQREAQDEVTLNWSRRHLQEPDLTYTTSW